MHLIELCAGTAAVGFAALGARFPCSRIGCKAGWVGPILATLGGPIRRVTLVEADPRLASLLSALLTAEGRSSVLSGVVDSLDQPARLVWERARAGDTPADTLLWLAGARGGVGGFKGGHKHRPNVDGFTPSRASLVRRLHAFAPVGAAQVLCQDASALDPQAFDPCVVYIDPPYVGRTGYAKALLEPVELLALRWARAGHRVVVSEAHPLPGASEVQDITDLRVGQARRSLTRDQAEWLSVYSPSSHENSNACSRPSV